MYICMYMYLYIDLYVCNCIHIYIYIHIHVPLPSPRWSIPRSAKKAASSGGQCDPSLPAAGDAEFLSRSPAGPCWALLVADDLSLVGGFLSHRGTQDLIIHFYR